MVLLPTTVVGSYSVPEWLERLKTECYQRRISAQHLGEIHEVAIRHLAPEVARQKLRAMVAGGRIRFSGLASELRDRPELLSCAYLLRGSEEKPAEPDSVGPVTGRTP